MAGTIKAFSARRHRKPSVGFARRPLVTTKSPHLTLGLRSLMGGGCLGLGFRV